MKSVADEAGERWWNDSIDVPESDSDEFDHKFTINDHDGSPSLWGGLDPKGCVSLWDSGGGEIMLNPHELGCFLVWYTEKC